MNRPERTTSSDASRTAALHRNGNVWYGVVGRTTGDDQFEIIATRAFPDADPAAVDQWLNDQRAGHIIGVLPACSTVVRNCTLPNAGPEQLQSALRLQAETQLLGAIPAHRIGLATLAPAPGEGNRCGLIVAWPEKSTFDPPIRRHRYRVAPDVAALAALLNGQRPSEPLLWADAHSGVVTLAMPNAGGATFRATREDAHTDDSWREGVARVVAETALNAGYSTSFIDRIRQDVMRELAEMSTRDSGLLRLPEEVIAHVRKRVTGAQNGPTWWNQYGIATGVLLAHASKLAPLTQLQTQPPREEPSPVDRVVRTLSKRRTATSLVVLAVLLLVLSPLIAAGIRHTVLTRKVGNVAEQRAALERLDQQISMYSAMQNRVWPINKLLADIVTNAPVGVELDSITINQGDALTVTGRVTKQGEVPAQEIALQMQRNLESTGIFSEARYSIDSPGAHGDVFRFNLTARVGNPHVMVAYDEARDFASLTLRERIYGPMPDHLRDDGDGDTVRTAQDGPPTGDPDDASPGDQTGDGDEGGAGETRIADAGGDEAGTDVTGDGGGGERDRPRNTPFNTRPPGSGGSNAGSRQDGDPTGLPPSQDIPRAHTIEEIDAMSFTDARELMVRVATALNRAALDEETKARLDQEFEWLKNRVRRGDG